MKTTLAVALLLTSILPAALGQYGQAIKRAKQVSNENNVRQDVPSPAQQQPTPPPPAPATPGNPVPQAQTLMALQADLASFKTGTPATDAQKQQFTITLAKAARGTKPSLGPVKKFVDSLTSALSGASLTEAQRQRLAQNIDAILNSRGLATAQFDKIIDDTDAILRVGSIKGLTATGIAADLKAIGMAVRH